jgi:hypothetical protein
MFFGGKGGKRGKLGPKIGMEPDGHVTAEQPISIRLVAPLKHTTINVRAGGDGLERPGGGTAGEAAAAAARQWQPQLGSSVAGNEVEAVRQWRRRQRQRGGGSQLGGGGGSLAEA